MKKTIFLISCLTVIYLMNAFKQDDSIAIAQSDTFSLVDENFKFKGEQIEASILKAFTTWWSDTGTIITGINLSDAVGSNQFSEDTKINENTKGRKRVWTEIDGGYFGYEYLGHTHNGVHILKTFENGGGTLTSVDLLLVTIQEQTVYKLDESLYVGGVVTFKKGGEKRAIIQKLGSISLGDRYAGNVLIKGNSLYIGKGEDWFNAQGNLLEIGGPKKPVEIKIEL